MRENEALAQSRLNKAFDQARKEQSPNDQVIAKNAATAEAKQLYDQLSAVLCQLSNHVDVAVKDIDWITDMAIVSMQRTVVNATKTILEARDRAITKITKMKQSRLH